MKNLKNLAKNLAQKHNCKHLVMQKELKDLIANNDDIKIIGLTDENLGNAILNRYKELN